MREKLESDEQITRLAKMFADMAVSTLERAQKEEMQEMELIMRGEALGFGLAAEALRNLV